MVASAFAAILGEVLARIPGAYAAALVDNEGETVDYAGASDPYDLKIAAAYLRICLHELESIRALGEPRWVTVRGARKSLVARTLEDGYALVLLLRRRAGFTASQRAFAACARALAREAGWAHVESGPVWHPIAVEIDRRGRPRRLGRRSLPVEVLGSVAGLPAKERGFRVRTAEGSELTLIREAGNWWYSDERADD
jgi:hypothetical protein